MNQTGKLMRFTGNLRGRLSAGYPQTLASQTMRRIFTIISVALLLNYSFAMAADTPSEVVRKFCQLDYQGSRLSSDGFKAIKSLIAYPEEPGCYIAIGIRSFKIKSEKIHGNKAEVVVEYDIDQSWPSGIDVGNTEVAKLVKSNGIWRIEKYIEYPRVSSEVLCTKFRKCK